MVDFKNIRFTVPEVVQICTTVAGLVLIYATFSAKIDILIASYEKKEAKDDQLHKEQTIQYQNIIVDHVLLGSRVTQLEQKTK